MTKKIAILFRYGAGEHVHFLPALPKLVEILSQGGVEVHHFGYKSTCVLPDEIKKFVTVHEGPFQVNRGSESDKKLKAFLWLMGLPLLGWRLQRQGYDRVFVDETLPLSAPLLRLGFKRKLLFTIHDFFIEIYWNRSFGLRWLGRVVQSLDEKAWLQLDRVFTRVEAAKRHLILKGVSAEKITVVPDSVDLKLFCPCINEKDRQKYRATLGVGPKEILLVHHGIMHPNKGNLRLVQAFDRLEKRAPQTKLLLIGDGSEMKELREYVNRRKLNSCIFLVGWLPGIKEIASALQASDIGVVMRKGFPGDHFHVTSTLVHNLASGLPILSARLDGIAEVIEEGVQGYMFDPVCADELEKKLIDLAGDEAQRVQMGMKARKLAEDYFDPNRIAAEYARWILA